LAKRDDYPYASLSLNADAMPIYQIHASDSRIIIAGDERQRGVRQNPAYRYSKDKNKNSSCIRGIFIFKRVSEE